MTEKGLHSLWGHVVSSKYDPDYMHWNNRAYRITSATLQSFHDPTTACAIYLHRANEGTPLQIALLTNEVPSVTLDIVIETHQSIAYQKKTFPDTDHMEVQLTGHYLDGCHVCCGLGMSSLSFGGKKTLLLSTEGDGTVNNDMKVQIRKRQSGDFEKIELEKQKLVEELKVGNRLVEKLYSQVEELMGRVKYLEEKA